MLEPSTRIVSLIALALLSSCSDMTSTGDDLADARARWNASRPASYEFTLAVSCFCITDVTRPVVVVVTGTTVTSRTYVATGAQVPAQYAATFLSIDGLFDKLADARSRNAARAEATYDPATGYPREIALDYSQQVADDELFYAASALKAR